MFSDCHQHSQIPDGHDNMNRHACVIYGWIGILIRITTECLLSYTYENEGIRGILLSTKINFI